jgi:hypothetical protein
MSSSGIWSLMGLARTDILEEYIASIFRVEKILQAKKSISSLLTD